MFDRSPYFLHNGARKPLPLWTRDRLIYSTSRPEPASNYFDLWSEVYPFPTVRDIMNNPERSRSKRIRYPSTESVKGYDGGSPGRARFRRCYKKVHARKMRRLDQTIAPLHNRFSGWLD